MVVLEEVVKARTGIRTREGATKFSSVKKPLSESLEKQDFRTERGTHFRGLYPSLSPDKERLAVSTESSSNDLPRNLKE